MTEFEASDRGLRIEVSETRGALILKTSGYIDLSTVDVLENAINDAVDRAAPVLVVDMKNIEFLGSAGLSLLARTHTRLQAPHRMVVVVNDVAARPLQITGLDKVLSIVDAIETAVPDTDPNPNAVTSP